MRHGVVQGALIRAARSTREHQGRLASIVDHADDASARLEAVPIDANALPGDDPIAHSAFTILDRAIGGTWASCSNLH